MGWVPRRRCRSTGRPGDRAHTGRSCPGSGCWLAPAVAPASPALVYSKTSTGNGRLFVRFNAIFNTIVIKLLSLLENKRAQRALGRSPEEKVNGHSKANNREPQGHNLNKFGRGPFHDVIY